ncbi:hypothetical protein U3516DRAFT_768786 [Neocallimastix sp. 'constans']
MQRLEFKLPFIKIPINTNTSRLSDHNADCEMCKRSKNKINSPEISINVSTNCTKNSQYNICKFNEDDIIRRCHLGRCGRFIGDPCENKYDCSDGECDRVCYMPIPPRVNELDSFFSKSKTTKSYKEFNTI